MSILTQALEKIIDWLRVNTPESVSELRPGLSDLEIDRILENLPPIIIGGN